MSIQNNLKTIEERICSACERAARARDEVKLIAVSKRKPAEAVLKAAQAGHILFGENRVQEAQAKFLFAHPICTGTSLVTCKVIRPNLPHLDCFG